MDFQKLKFVYVVVSIVLKQNILGNINKQI